MPADVLEELLLLCRAAAEAGEDWRRRLEREWLPQVLATQRDQLAHAIASWSGRGVSDDEAMKAAALTLIAEAMEDARYM
ncbi:hypothetical protein EG19_07035 [Thermoanaerobaculum aquaticum]|jgi:hypothetical protein|uniref:Uncharacterized protein n=1 Tax=Thermoanaerobaculum aquaticum TaxID=1312852 RepID=A0A062XV09_9BACT|nr:hypothetical protein [Thermoanaerobaculum aquaticum]KDA53234.1 hypothetical protein EG19_07035 [Thermoanaerobaculum aquaticum]